MSTHAFSPRQGPILVEAIEQASQALVQWLGSARVVQVSIPVSSTGNPWLDSFGRSANDPDFDEYLAEIKHARAADPSE